MTDLISFSVFHDNFVIVITPPVTPPIHSKRGKHLKTQNTSALTTMHTACRRRLGLHESESRAAPPLTLPGKMVLIRALGPEPGSGTVREQSLAVYVDTSEPCRPALIR